MQNIFFPLSGLHFNAVCKLSILLCHVFVSNLNHQNLKALQISITRIFKSPLQLLSNTKYLRLQGF